MTDQKELEIHTLINENDIKDDKKIMWESCCIRTNPHAIAYIGQFIFSMSVLAFSCIMISTSEGQCDRISPFVSIISFLMGKILSSVVSSA